MVPGPAVHARGEGIDGLGRSGELHAAVAQVLGPIVDQIDLPMFRAPTFAVTAAVAVLFMVTFAGVLLGNVLFLTGPWHYSTLSAGLLFAPGPLVAAIFAVPGGRLGQRFSAGPVIAAGPPASAWPACRGGCW